MNLTRFQRLGREFFWVSTGQVSAAIGSIVGVRLLTHNLTPTAYGELALGMTVATLSQQTLLAPLSGATLRFFAPAQEAKQLSSYLRGTRVLLVRVSGIIVALLGVIAVSMWLLGHTTWLSLIVGSFGFALVSGMSSVMDGMQNAARQRVVVAWHDGLAPWLRFFTAVALIRLLGALSSVAMFGYGLASAVVLVSQCLFFRRRILILDKTNADPGDARMWRQKMYNYGWPFAMTGIFAWVHASSDRWALQTFATTKSVGFYAVLYQIGYYPISLFANMVTQLVTPVVFSLAGDGSDAARMQKVRELNKKMVLATLGLTGLATLVTAILHGQIFALFVPSEYFGVSQFLPWMTCAGGIYAASQMAMLLILSGMNTKQIVSFRILGGVLGICLNIVGAWIWGLNGVIGAILVWAVFYLLWMLRLWGTLKIQPSTEYP